MRRVSDQTEGGLSGRYLEGRGGGGKGKRTEMGGRSCKSSGVPDPVIPAGVLGPEAGDAVIVDLGLPVGSADRRGLAIPLDNKGGASLGITLGGLKGGWRGMLRSRGKEERWGGETDRGKSG